MGVISWLIGQQGYSAGCQVKVVLPHVGLIERRKVIGHGKRTARQVEFQNRVPVVRPAGTRIKSAVRRGEVHVAVAVARETLPAHPDRTAIYLVGSAVPGRDLLQTRGAIGENPAVRVSVATIGAEGDVQRAVREKQRGALKIVEGVQVDRSAGAIHG